MNYGIKLFENCVSVNVVPGVVLAVICLPICNFSVFLMVYNPQIAVILVKMDKGVESILFIKRDKFILGDIK